MTSGHRDRGPDADALADDGRLGTDEPREVIRSEEELVARREPVEVGRVHVRKEVTSHPVEQLVARSIEHAEVERTPPFDDDDGQTVTYDDGSMSIPVLEEELVVTTRTVVRERILIRKQRVRDDQVVSADLRREEVVVEADESVADRVHRP